MALTCGNCGSRFESAQSKARFCSPKCRTAAFRAGKRAVSEPSQVDVTAVSRVRAELDELGQLETVSGAVALALAARIDASTAVMGFAQLGKELRATMAEIRDASDVGEGDELDDLARRRAARSATA